MGKKAQEKRRKRRPNGLAVDPLLAEAERFLSDGSAAAADDPEAEAGAAAPRRAAVPAAEGRARLELVVAADGMEATVRRLPPEASAEEVLAGLEAAGVTAGIDLAAIRLALRTARESGGAVEGVVVARGTAPRSPGPPQLEYCPPPSLEALPVLDGVALAQSLPDPKAVRRALKGLRGWLVPAGQVLAEVRGDAGTAGVTVRGEPVPPGLGPAGAPRTEPGPGVSLSPEMTRYTASRSGYAGLLGGRPAVLSPVWIAPDGMEAGFLTLRLVPGSATLTAAQVGAALAEGGVRVEANAAAVASLVEMLAADETRRGIHPLAVGKAPVPARDAVPEFAFQHQTRAGAVRADGTIDFRERNAFPAVHAGDLLVRCGPPVPGTPGQTVQGEEIPVGLPRGAELVAGEQTRQEEKDGVAQLFAESDGGASVQVEQVRGEGVECTRYTVAVHPVAQVGGDVGYDTGNIEVPGSVAVAGSVKAGFRVQAVGDVVIAGSVENGAVVEAGGSVTVQQ
ncbi:MAG: flagellar assembly protein A, partial [Gemmatimonadota bacterium]